MGETNNSSLIPRDSERVEKLRAWELWMREYLTSPKDNNALQELAQKYNAISNKQAKSPFKLTPDEVESLLKGTLLGVSLPENTIVKVTMSPTDSDYRIVKKQAEIILCGKNPGTYTAIASAFDNRNEPYLHIPYSLETEG